MRSRLLVAAVGVPVLLVVVLWAPVWVLAVFLAVLSMIAAGELMKCVGAWEHKALCAACAAAAGLPVLLAWYRLPLYGALAAAWVLAVFAYAVAKAGAVGFGQIMAALFAVLAVPWAFAAFLRLNAAGLHRGFLLLPLLFSFASDTGAFFAGRAFGKHKLSPRVSPHKTVEGAAGGLAANALAGAAFAAVMNRWFGCGMGYWQTALLGLLCSVVAQLGDLSFSLIKREFGIKDYGRIFLEHGGVLDRFDSVIFVAPVLAILLPLLGV